jgi:hypothetical protein
MKTNPMAAAILAGGLFAAAGSAQGTTATQVAGARAALEQWVATSRLIAKERRDWTLGRGIVADRIELMKAQIAALRARIAETVAGITATDAKKVGLIAKRAELDANSAALRSALALLDSRTVQLLRRVPEPALQRVEALRQQIPATPDETRVPLGDRFRNVIGILNELNKFNRDIHVASEVRTLDDGTRTEVTVFYLGLGSAYFANAKGSVGGFGSVAPEAWTWTVANAAAPRIQRAIRILRGEEIAAFVPLPVRIR